MMYNLIRVSFYELIDQWRDKGPFIVTDNFGNLRPKGECKTLFSAIETAVMECHYLERPVNIVCGPDVVRKFLPSEMRK